MSGTIEPNVRPSATAAPDEEKRFANAAARAALAGVTLIADSTPRFLASRWGLMRVFDSLEAVERWLDLVTGVRV